MSIADLAREMKTLDRLPPIERAAQAGRLASEVRTALTEVRLAAIHEATREAGSSEPRHGAYREVAYALGLSEKAIDRAVQEYRRRARVR
jgi:hypothetical protein